MAQDTKNKILDAAETLFSQQGFMQTSMREITTLAGVNLASVNYHFGSKKNLIQSVLKRYLDVLMPQFDTILNHSDCNLECNNLEGFLASLVPPMMTLQDVSPNGTEKFVQLLGKGYNETQGHLRRFIMNDYGVTISRLIEHIKLSLPSVSEEVLFWRLHFAMGSFVFSMASSQALKEIAKSDFNSSVDVSDVILQMVPFVAHGLASGSYAN